MASTTVGKRLPCNCLICNHQFICEVTFSNQHSISDDAVEGKVIVTENVLGSNGRIALMDIHVKCPDCGVTNLIKESVDLK